MESEDDLLANIVKDLGIPKESVNVKSIESAVALVDDEWLCHLTEEEQISGAKIPEHLSDFQLSASLQHNISSLKGFTKLYIQCYAATKCIWGDGSSCLNNDVLSFGQLCDYLSDQCFCNQWRISCLTHSDNYQEEDFKAASHLYLPNTSFSDLDQVEAIDTSSNEIFLITGTNIWKHVNVLPILAAVRVCNRLYIIKKCILHSVFDSVMYSPSWHASSLSKPLFLVFQLLKFMNFASVSSPITQLNYLTWKKIALDELLWIQADFNSFSLKNVDKENASEEVKQNQSDVEKREDDNTLQKLLDLWICGKLSNYEYLMFLNQLAGRRKNDPNHHPIMPWVSDLSVQDGGWRDFTKSKYRLNKGDDQLQLQYAMAASSHNINIPYHVPDMLSDITYYVYKARVIPKTVLQKHVRSYWEPNEYPSTVQRMQEWTPDECIPEFYTDPSIFKSHHSDMVDLGVPDWCTTPEDFVKKHMSMLEGDFVSQRLHNWIDITFGYKLSGKHAIQSLNVCRQLVDKHSHLTTHGIVQLFHAPHPQKRLTTLISPEQILLSIKWNVGAKQSSSERKIELESTEKQLADGSDSVKDDETATSEVLNAKNNRKIRLPDDFDPFRNLDQLETLLNFKSSETDSWDLSPELKATVRSNVNSIARCTEEEMVGDYNMLVLMCLIAELFMLPHANNVAENFPLSSRLARASLFFDSNKHQLPTTVKTALNHLFRSLTAPTKRICELLRKCEAASVEGEPLAHVRIFKWINSRGYPAPRPLHLLTEAFSIFRFPVFFEKLHSFLGQLLMHTNYYQEPLDKQLHAKLRNNLSSLLARMNGNREGMEILLLHIIRLFNQPLPHSAETLPVFFDLVAKELGPENTNKHLLPSILSIYNRLNEDCSQHSDETLKLMVETLYDKYFLVQLLTRLGLHVFLETFSRPLAQCLTVNYSHSGMVLISVQWLLTILGPTLASKYVIRHLLLILNTCYSDRNFEGESPPPGNDELILSCLIYAANVYGSPLVTLQYLPHVSYSVCSAIRGTCFTEQSYSALEAATSLLIAIVPSLSDSTLMEELNRMSKEIIMPLIGVISSRRLRFPGGANQRKYLCLQTIDLLLKIALRIGRDMSRAHLTEMLQSFFKNFSIHNNLDSENSSSDQTEEEDEFAMDIYDSAILIPSSLAPEVDTITAALQEVEAEAMAEITPQAATKPRHLSVADEKIAEEISVELRSTFDSESAYRAYIPFARLMGGMHMEEILEDNDVVWRLSSRVSDSAKEKNSSETPDHPSTPSTITLVGNQIVVDDKQDSASSANQAFQKKSGDDEFHLKGNWLAYWEHEVGLAIDDNHIHFNQIELNSYQGHTSAVKSLCVNNTEEWFLSGSKDKTVKIWSLCKNNQESGLPLFVYQHHKKSVFYSAVLESRMSAVSCDGSIHVWDPYTGKQIKCYESSDFKANVSNLCVLPPPQQQLLVATSDTNLRMVDMRTNSMAQEYKSVVGQSVGLVRSLCARSSWVAVGFTSGVISLLDLRMGTVLRMWQAHENDILSSMAVGQSNFITSSLDQTLAFWEVTQPQPLMVYKSIPESATVVRTFHNEILSATSSNKFLVHAMPHQHANGDAMKSTLEKPLHLTKLRSDTLRGNLTTFAVLPMKRQLLLASESGSVKLLT